MRGITQKRCYVIQPVLGKIIFLMILNQNQNHEFKNDFKSKSKSCFHCTKKMILNQNHKKMILNHKIMVSKSQH